MTQTLNTGQLLWATVCKCICISKVRPIWLHQCYGAAAGVEYINLGRVSEAVSVFNRFLFTFAISLDTWSLTLLNLRYQ